MDTSRLFKKNPHGSTRRPMSTVSQKLVAKSERPSNLASENPKSTLSLDYCNYEGDLLLTFLLFLKNLA